MVLIATAAAVTKKEPLRYSSKCRQMTPLDQPTLTFPKKKTSRKNVVLIYLG